MSEAILTLKDICFSYHSAAPAPSKVPGQSTDVRPFIDGNQELALDNLNFEIFAGQRLGLVGGNGAGKTTLLHLMVGLVKPLRGDVSAFGKVRREEADFYEVRCRTGLCFQNADDQLFCPTVAEDVCFGPLNLGKSRAEALAISRKLLADLGLVGFGPRVTHHLSGGEKRIVALASVLSMQPDILLLDEPTSGLDDEACTRLIDVLNGLQQAKLIVSHDRNFLDAVCDNILHLKDGKICAT